MQKRDLYMTYSAKSTKLQIFQGFLPEETAIESIFVLFKCPLDNEAEKKNIFNKTRTWTSEKATILIKSTKISYVHTYTYIDSISSLIIVS